ncbi:hypothetical protein KIP31_00085 [Xanthomonas campestris pv. campestris]|uniref:hypothetical protein n=1 Tax=Xanthomonas campestris TaxID=339 RepID=UPI0011C04543|nr:hypothetical protein [Xanthomonas campestris]MCF8807779.1 hypothetical protein [Xanthomonas campestris pv. campestris]MDO0791602.1 hypothetical protein [Xanthomonas campestris pv. campestris]MEA0939617.1 hypothetical protein [Xanthomonas campestris pv. campestris]MEA0960447.1 hypothetical protein [Xanthomonas campestris pv. campestris]MEA9569953.1 hypothetical protein [Xanthomonas campestris]
MLHIIKSNFWDAFLYLKLYKKCKRYAWHKYVIETSFTKIKIINYLTLLRNFYAHMLTYFEKVNSQLQSTSSDIEARVVWISSVRHMVQLIDYCLVEWISGQNPDPANQPPRETLLALYSAADGTLIEALDALLVSAESCGWQGVYKTILATIPENNPAAKLCASQPKTFQGLLRTIVELRNDGGEGHGLPGGYLREEEQAAYSFILDCLSKIMPWLQEEDKIFFGPEECMVEIKVVKVIKGNPVLVRGIMVLGTERLRIKGKYFGADHHLEEITYETVNPFSAFEGRSLPSLEIFDNSWSPLVYLPSRITDTFTARDKELGELKEWLEDLESRACLVFGDGGVGKTTLVIEAIRRLLEEDFTCTWQPKIITFYTAKRTQFGPDGLSAIGMGRPNLHGLLVHLHNLLLGKPPQADFYKKDVASAAIYIQNSMQKELDLLRKDHLLIIDNAETLIESEADREALGKEIKEISRRVGRVLITSRRREILGADPVEVEALSARDAVTFLRHRGVEKLKIRSLKKSTDKELLALVGELERRPIVLDSLINVLQDPAYDSLAKARQRVSGMLAKDLGQFLFSDAWTRFSQPIQKLLILMTRVADVHDAQLLRICSDVYQVSVQDAERSLEESSGIASVVHLDGGLQVSFSRNFLDFCKGRDCPRSEIDKAIFAYRSFLERARSFSGDRIAAAFRTPQARAAHKYRNERNLDEAEKMYEQAILADAMNGLLFDRFAYFLAQDVKNLDAALHKAKKATELLPGEAEVWFTRGLIESKKGDVRAARISLERAERLGFSSLRCAIQLCWGYLFAKPRQMALAKSQLFIVDSKSIGMEQGSKELTEIQRLRVRVNQA